MPDRLYHVHLVSATPRFVRTGGRHLQVRCGFRYAPIRGEFHHLSLAVTPRCPSVQNVAIAYMTSTLTLDSSPPPDFTTDVTTTTPALPAMKLTMCSLPTIVMTTVLARLAHAAYANIGCVTPDFLNSSYQSDHFGHESPEFHIPPIGNVVTSQDHPANSNAGCVVSSLALALASI